MMPSDTRSAHDLDAASIVETIERLHARVAERFPESSLSGVCADLAQTARATAANIRRLSRPYLGLRLLAAMVIAAGLVGQIYVARLVDWLRVLRHADAVAIAQGLDATVNLLILAFAGLWFVMTLEVRLKRRRVLRQLHELRAFSHVIDMHQLTKDPTVLLSPLVPTASSPARRMSEFQLSRYLDYCTEMLALIAKLAALYAGEIQDPAVISAVNDVEELTSSLGRKIWQKIMIISQLDERQAAAQPPTSSQSLQEIQ